MELQSTALPTELRGVKLPRGFEPRVVDSKSTVFTNYTIGASLILVLCPFSLSSFMYFILISETENRPADVFATIMGTTVKYMEYTRPNALANMLMHRNV